MVSDKGIGAQGSKELITRKGNRYVSRTAIQAGGGNGRGVNGRKTRRWGGREGGGLGRATERSVLRVCLEEGGKVGLLNTKGKKRGPLI